MALVSTGEKRKSEITVSDPASKRRRLSDASVLCVRELFRATVRDGTISTEERIILQNAAVLLSQVKGDQWVTFPDNDGVLRDLNLTRHQTMQLKSFLERVAHEIQKTHADLPREGSDVSEQMQLSTVPWAEGCSALELLHCLTPEVELMDKGKFGWIEKATAVLPSQFMLRIRAKELINHYQMKHLKSEPPPPTHVSEPSSTETSGPWHKLAVMKKVGVAGVKGTVYPVQFCIHGIAHLVIAVARILLYLYFVVSDIITGYFPFWPFISFSLLAISHGRAIRFFDFIVLMARWRVCLCLASGSEFFGYMFSPFVYVANNFLKWKEGITPKLVGCACETDGVPSILALIPYESANAVLWLLKFVTFLPLPSSIEQHIEPFFDVLRPVLIMVFDLLFSIGVAEGLATILKFVDGWAQPKLVLMSMDVGRRIRHDLLESKPHGSEASAASDSARASGGSAPVPEWREDGAWSVFDMPQ